MKKLFLIALVLLLHIVIFGCSSANTTNTDLVGQEKNTIVASSNNGKDIENLIRKSIDKKYKINDLTIKEISTNENSFFVMFLIKKNNILYEGLAYIEKEDKLYRCYEIDIAKVDSDVPFTKHTLSVLLKDGRNCRLQGGYINSNKIKEIHIESKNNTIDVIKLGQNQNTYMNYLIGNVDSVSEIIGLDQENEKVYSYQ